MCKRKINKRYYNYVIFILTLSFDLFFVSQVIISYYSLELKTAWVQESEVSNTRKGYNRELVIVAVNDPKLLKTPPDSRDKFNIGNEQEYMLYKQYVDSLRKYTPKLIKKETLYIIGIPKAPKFGEQIFYYEHNGMFIFNILGKNMLGYHTLNYKEKTKFYLFLDVLDDYLFSFFGLILSISFIFSISLLYDIYFMKCKIYISYYLYLKLSLLMLWILIFVLQFIFVILMFIFSVIAYFFMYMYGFIELAIDYFIK